MTGTIQNCLNLSILANLVHDGRRLNIVMKENRGPKEILTILNQKGINETNHPHEETHLGIVALPLGH